MTKGSPATTTVTYPLYDPHGNLVAQLSASGSSYSLGNQRTFDAWGLVRSGYATGAPSQRYCGNLGHVQDDESGLIYMRARYYEPATGRFISQDPSRNGRNWFIYANGNPVNQIDKSGHASEEDLATIFGLVGFTLTVAAIGCLYEGNYAQAIFAANGAVAFFALAAVPLDPTHVFGYVNGGIGAIAWGLSGMFNPETAAGLRTQAGIAVAAAIAECLYLYGYMLSIGADV